MARDSKGITQFYLPPTHEPYLSLLPSRRASPPFSWYSLISIDWGDFHELLTSLTLPTVSALQPPEKEQ